MKLLNYLPLTFIVPWGWVFSLPNSNSWGLAGLGFAIQVGGFLVYLIHGAIASS